MNGLLEKFVQGVMFGVGVVVVLVLAFLFFGQFIFGGLTPSFTEDSGAEHSQEYLGVPAIEQGYLGVHSIRRGHWPNKLVVIGAGPGEIVGKVVAEGEPRAGVRLRLYLNGAAQSQWAVSDELGVYRIPVPEGEYRIDGLELDMSVAHATLSGLILSPNIDIDRDNFYARKAEPARGLQVSFVKPVIKNATAKRYGAEEPIVLSWRAYEGAKSYRIQLWEMSSPGGGHAKGLFSWRDTPEVETTEINMRDYATDLKSGLYYYFSVTAFDGQGREISESTGALQSYDFKLN
ncbi:carboxypeptidase-like regulatory domain-containing protein [Gilvimarinus xylanilyticus]|uniref:Carboxypeptidase-like regulatory domain-containing protein n=1 Tax=Gilvimarinus xylanilyticus TaxID=2944139 RepID=A0A9X2KRQ9_9GAMM|nr:carboxypeptidase-like regulatory domain-containing protein [Gilvimarinus xylanilyticus]MCP8898121.1 carboxypeptidase-like regulatory domain-containing protein [Gilvimarinus xylanilyticus]